MLLRALLWSPSHTPLAFKPRTQSDLRRRCPRAQMENLSPVVVEEPRMVAVNQPNAFRLSGHAWEEICRHAEAAFPEECCGVVLSDGVFDQVRPLNNIQNQLHALDPETYPRTAAIAYAMDPHELDRVISEAEARGLRLTAFYHSHPEHEAYFSEEDKAFASPFGEPNFPGAAQIVVSVYSRAVKRLAAFGWSDEKQDFVEIPLERT